MRRIRNVGQLEVARAIGKTRSSVANIEGGRQNLTVAVLSRLAGYFAVSVGVLVGVEPLPLPKTQVQSAHKAVCEQCGVLDKFSDEKEAEAMAASHVAGFHQDNS